MSTPEPSVVKHTAATPPPHAEPRADDAPSHTVLLVEDDRALRRFLEVTLERAGYRVVAASDGLEAMKAALSTDINAVVTDAVMPHLGGRELCGFLRRHPKLRALPVVLLSGSEGAGVPAGEASERPDVCLTKPVRPEELTNCLASLLERDA
ncbi:MAG TPA: response regulator [Pyrinomonadaceae bacterium]|nr:response regulator [Pyrinomonadaceae bacterium]